MGSPVVHFEIQATDRPALAAFYEEVFGWKTQSAPGMPYTLIDPTGKGVMQGQPPAAGIGGGMLDRNGSAPKDGDGVNGFVCILQVDDADAKAKEVEKYGCAIQLPPTDIEGVGRVFYFKDPDGNLVGCIA